MASPLPPGPVPATVPSQTSVTYFADVTTNGNTILYQNLSSLGMYSKFTNVSANYISGNVWSATMNATSLYCSQFSNTILTTISGNIYASNSITSPNSFFTNVNVSSVSNIYSTSIQRFSINDATATGNTLEIGGNIFISKSIQTTNISVPLANTNFLNTSSFSQFSPNLGNIFVSNTVQTTNVVSTLANAATVNCSVPYLLSTYLQTPHLLPSVSNAAQIQQWISYTCSSKIGWASSANPLYYEIPKPSCFPYAATNAILIPDGRIIFDQYDSLIDKRVLCSFNPITNTVTQTKTYLPAEAAGVLNSDGTIVYNIRGSFYSYNYSSDTLNTILSVPIILQLFISPVLTSNGIVFGPNLVGPSLFNFSNISVLNNGKLFNCSTHNDIFISSTLLPNGNVFMIPGGQSPTGAGPPGSDDFYLSNAGMFNPTTFTYSNIFIPTTAASGPCVLSPDGNVVVFPRTQVGYSNLIIFNTTTLNFTEIVYPEYAIAVAACILPNGNIVSVNAGTGSICLTDPIKQQISVVYDLQTGSGPGTLLPDGRVIFIGQNIGIFDTTTPTSKEFCLSPYYNGK